jgi:GT2 family glycosyltransferase
MTDPIMQSAATVAVESTVIPTHGASHSTPPIVSRPVVRGKFLFADGHKLYIKGVTYGTFAPTANGEEYDRDKVRTDFGMMASHGINAVRVYTVPPRWLLDAAQQHGLRVVVGLPWEQHVTFLDNRNLRRSIENRVREGVGSCAGHPAVLCFTLGNEIPASIVRWHGAKRVEAFLRRLAGIVRTEDPGALVTYVNFPSTEYLQLDFVDFVSFNVYLESPEKLDPYLARLQNLAGEKPLVMAEIGLDSRRNGQLAQAAAMEWQIRSVFQAGGAGAFVFAWTDEWHRGGFEIDDWDFGLVDRQRQPKAALGTVATAFAHTPFPHDRDWPRISVVICSYNGSRTIADTMDGLAEVDYPDYEVIVIDDGSTDTLADIASGFDVRLIRTANQGLSAARNEGLRAATGEIVAYLDDDARTDPHWLRYLADAYARTGAVAAGGPNIAPAGAGFIAEAVAHAPGGPVHVLLTDTEADHLPGCNLSIRKSALEEIGGFDPRYRAAGDDVDVCWRLRDVGGALTFSPGAMVWHHRRNSARTYWKQQQGYGRAEALLEEKWPERYNPMGHVSWSGRIYGNGLPQTLSVRRGRIYQGTWGSALFQSVYAPAPGMLASLPLMPEWWFLVAAIGGLAALGFAWSPLLWLWSAFVLAALAPVAQAVLSAASAKIPGRGRSRWELFRLRALVAWLHFLQPIARLRGRIRFGLTPWRRRGWHGFTWPRTRVGTAWSESWRGPASWLGEIEERLRAEGAVVTRGGDWDQWDLMVRGGMLGGARVLMAIEEHGGERQLARFRIPPRVSGIGLGFLVGVALLAALALADQAWLAASLLTVVASLVVVRIVRESGSAMSIALRAIRSDA